jgi:hypothetical protein
MPQESLPSLVGDLDRKLILRKLFDSDFKLIPEVIGSDIVNGVITAAKFDRLVIGSHAQGSDAKDAAIRLKTNSDVFNVVIDNQLRV